MPEATQPGAADAAAKLIAAMAMAKRGGALFAGLGIGGLRLLAPALAAYAGTQHSPNDDDDQTDDPPKDADGNPRLTRRENAAISAAAAKAMLELIEITSVTDPIMPNATPYMAYDDGVFRAPHLSHLLSLVSASNRLLTRDKGSGDDIEEAQASATAPGVAYLAVAPGEYAPTSGSLTPIAIRRSAMRERTYNAPQLAMLAHSSNGFETAPASAGSAGGVNYNAQAYAARGGGALRRYDASGGCGCGSASGATSGGSCGCAACGGHADYQFSPARRDADGKCVSVLKISCDTGWRVRECLKISICELLRCVGDEVCDNGQFAANPDLKGCLEGFVCTLLTCLPEAICPTPPQVNCHPALLPDDCNYASGR
jgi:hypothetical protein